MVRTRRETVQALLAKQVVVPEWMAKTVAGLAPEALVDVRVQEAPFGTYVLDVAVALDVAPEPPTQEWVSLRALDTALSLEGGDGPPPERGEDDPPAQCYLPDGSTDEEIVAAIERLKKGDA